MRQIFKYSLYKTNHASNTKYLLHKNVINSQTTNMLEKVLKLKNFTIFITQANFPPSYKYYKISA